MKFLITGLGNPGQEYENTRHNIGFKALDALAGSDAFFSSDRYGHITEVSYKGRKLILLKPNTYMNLSGKAVSYWLQKEKISIQRLLVITDDINLPFGKIRMRKAGSDGGHNGLKSIQEILSSQQYCRIRFGVGSDFARGRQADYVLGNWNAEEEAVLPERLKLLEQMVQAFTTIGPDKTMSEFNNK